MPDRYLSGARVVKAHQTPYERRSSKDALSLTVEAIAGVCEAAGIAPKDVDGLAVASFELAPENVVTIADALGTTIRWAWQGAHGGAGGVVSVVQAAEAITLGRAGAIVCVAADAFTVDSHNAMLDRFNGAMRDYLAPYGFGGANGLFALVERAHRHSYGTRRESLGKIAITQRDYARSNPNALLRKRLTLDEYLEARVICDPVRLYDCVMPCTGGDAVLLMSAERAEAAGLGGATVLAGGQRHNHLPAEVLSLTSGAAAYADELFEVAGVARSDLDFVQLYDDYPIMVLIQLEDLGFAPKGHGGEFVDATDFGPRGDLPLNTGGGQLSCGQAGAAGGMIGMFEAITQLLGDADGRQLGSARVGLVSGFGMVGYGRGLSSATAILAAA